MTFQAILTKSARAAGVALALGLAVSVAGPARAEPSNTPCCGPVTQAGQRLAALLDSSGVDHLWRRATHIVWQTGEPDPARPGGTKHNTHCSAYAAAMAERAGIYLLRPPEHSQSLLANAQMAWLQGETGRADGWQPLATPRDAQAAANRGEFVVAVFQNPDPHRPGHIAVLRPSEKTQAELDRDGPQEAQAGSNNAVSTVVAAGFRHHPGAWEQGGEGGAIRYFAHPVAWPATR
ncbi:MAG: hypothetical protein JSR21_01770 [Proteobacteria bacterium]|nr:hypothetical protein [Pseudomonadota bacterium]